MRKKRCTKALVERTRKATNICYEYVVDCAYLKHKDILISMFDEFYRKEDFIHGLRMARLWYEDDTRDLFNTISTEVDDQYLVEVCKLPTVTLEEILLAHDAGKFGRASRTVETIKLELATRGLLL
jgi:hypothetical protein